MSEDEKQQLLDRLIFGEIQVTDPELGRIMLQDPSFAEEVRRLETMLHVLHEELAASNQDSEAGDLARGDESPYLAPSQANIESTQALLAAVEDPGGFLRAKKSKRNRMLKICVPAAAIVLASATLYQFDSTKDPARHERPLLGDGQSRGQLASNRFTKVIIPVERLGDEYELELISPDGELLLQSGRFAEAFWEIPKDKMPLLAEQDQLKVNLTVFKNRRASTVQLTWKR